MILVIDTYTVPYKKISKRFNLNNAKHLTTTVNDKNEIYFYHKEEQTDELHKQKYFFEEIYEVEGEYILYINKKKGVARRYGIGRVDGRVTAINEITAESSRASQSKNEFLPFIDAQEDEIVTFPSSEE